MDGTCSTNRRCLELRGSFSWSCVRGWNEFYRQTLFGTERKNFVELCSWMKRVYIQALFETERKLFVELCSWMERVLQTGAVWN